jgi:hypothetical protein
MLLMPVSMLAISSSYLCTSEIKSVVTESKNGKLKVDTFTEPYQIVLKPTTEGGVEYGVYGIKDGSLLFECSVWMDGIDVARCGNTSDYHLIFSRNDGNPKFSLVDLGWKYVTQSESLMGMNNTPPRLFAGSCLQLN